jgi:sulfatase modifying factor 1
MIRTFLLLFIAASFPQTCFAAVTFDWAYVGNAGNAPDVRYDAAGYGSVGYAYNIGKYEVTNAQYIEFLNAVAASRDIYGVYDSSMGGTGGGISRSGSGTVSDPYVYAVKGGNGNWFNRPVNYISWGDAARFANWLHNGQPKGSQDLTTTEDGAYFLNGATSDAALMAANRKAGAIYFLPSEDEWYKAAYHKNDGVTSNYYEYTTSSDSLPSNDFLTPDPGNNANFYQRGLTMDDFPDLSIPYWSSEVGAFENSESAYGTFDQGGNVAEWNETGVDGSFRGNRGGGFDGHDYWMHAHFRSYGRPTGESINKGFRIATTAIPEPTTLALAAMLAGCGMMERRR